ncbi:hypothetical protein CASFOL_042518 [Castilleja foliolosa]|uniref:Uncharacterized protein n=1 Tax=Castilleja foliolosa TaxID=1961234 RepID=A0ABD3BB11_9LAMI
MIVDEAERLVKIALEWLRGDRVEYRLFAAVLILEVEKALKSKEKKEGQMYKEERGFSLMMTQHPQEMLCGVV